MAYDTLLDQLMDEENTEIIELEQADGKLVRFEQIGVVDYEDSTYAMLRPLDMPEEQVIVFKLNPYDEDSLEFVADEKIAKQVIEIFNEEVLGDEENEEKWTSNLARDESGTR